MVLSHEVFALCSSETCDCGVSSADELNRLCVALEDDVTSSASSCHCYGNCSVRTMCCLIHVCCKYLLIHHKRGGSDEYVGLTGYGYS